jgi:hypothetical protein
MNTYVRFSVIYFNILMLFIDFFLKIFEQLIRLIGIHVIIAVI